MAFLSIIIPVYNGESFIKDCLDSILVQSFYDYELIVVDDGSTDNTLVILNEYANKDSRIKVITGSNNGVSRARNTGLGFAKGEYLMFIDADDLLTNNSLSYFYEEACKSRPDIIKGEYQAVDSNGKHLFLSNKRQVRLQYENKLLNNIEFFSVILQQEYFLWTNWYRAELFKEGVSFKTGICYMEDLLLNYDLYPHIQSAVYTSNIIYLYRQSDKSVTHIMTELNTQSFAKVIYCLLEYCGDPVYNDVKDCLRTQILHTFEAIVKFISLHSNEKQDRLISSLALIDMCEKLTEVEVTDDLVKNFSAVETRKVLLSRIRRSYKFRQITKRIRKMAYPFVSWLKRL